VAEISDGADRGWVATNLGLIGGIAAYVAWGLVPLYFQAAKQIPPKEMLAHRVIWSLIVVSVLFSLTGGRSRLAGSIRDWKAIRLLFLSTPLIVLNWYVFIYGVTSGQTVQTSLGYFLLPLVNVMIGMVLFRERLSGMQWFALSLVASGVSLMIVGVGIFPWIALTLAVSFSMYGICRKLAPVDSDVGLFIETLLMLPFALVMLGIWESDGDLHFGHYSRAFDLLIAASGIVTTFPLLCFAYAIRRLKFITIGFLQYIAPTLAMATAVLISGEPFTMSHARSFALIWLGLIVFLADAVRKLRSTSARQERVAASRKAERFVGDETGSTLY